jgi:hypothetical protein
VSVYLALFSHDESGRCEVGGTVSLLRIPVNLPPDRTYQAFLLYREVPTEEGGGADSERVAGLGGVQLEVGELRDLLRLDFSPLATSTYGLR